MADIQYYTSNKIDFNETLVILTIKLIYNAKAQIIENNKTRTMKETATEFINKHTITK